MVFGDGSLTFRFWKRIRSEVTLSGRTRGAPAKNGKVEKMPFTVRDAVFAFLRDAGITTVFGNPGSTELRFLRDWPADFDYVTALHEQSAVAMADGFAQVTGNAAFVNLHSAGGLGNGMGSVFSAFRNQTPLVITAGQQTRALMPAMPFLFAEDATVLPQPYVKWSCEPSRAEDVPAAIARAYRIALQRPYGPAFVSIPEDDWDRPADPVPERTIFGAFTAGGEALAVLAAALDAAARPALVAGPGVDRDGGGAALVALAERLEAPVWVSPFSSRCSFPERHPRFAGFLPPVRAGIGRILASYDLVLVLGAPIFTYHVWTSEPAFGPGTRVFHVVDDAAAAAAAPEGTSIVADTRDVLERLLPKCVATRANVRTAARPPAPALEPSDPISGPFALQAIARTLPQGAIVFEEAPTHRTAMHERLPIAQPGSFFAAASGSLGWALPAAIGAALGAPERPIVAILGDGSSLYSITALWTAARRGARVTFIILNNGSYAAMNEFSRYLRFENAPSFALEGLDFVRAAEAFGVRAERIERAAALEPALTAVFAARGPVLVDIPVVATAAEIY
jgi:benzoylformate decarboxylase